MKIHIEHETGYIDINSDLFFPCTIVKFKKLLKVIKLDYLHRNEIIESLKAYFKNRMSQLLDEIAAKKKETDEYKTKVKETEAALNAERERIRNGGSPPYFENKFYIEYKNYKYFVRQAESRMKILIKSKEQFKKYLELL